MAKCVYNIYLYTHLYINKQDSVCPNSATEGGRERQINRKAISVTNALIISFGLLQACYMGLPSKRIWKLQLVQNMATQAILGAQIVVHVTPLLHKLLGAGLHLVQFKVLVMTYKAIYVKGPGYPCNCFGPIISACPI